MKAARLKSAVRGVSLIELMVALVIGSLLILGAVTVFTQSRNTYRTSETAARLQETGRYAMSVLEADVRLAGFLGLTNRAEYIEVTTRGGPADAQTAADELVEDNCGNNWTANVVQFLDGRDSEDVGGSGYDLACDAADPVDWADVLVVRRAHTDEVAADGERIQIQSNRLRGEIFVSNAIPAGFAAAPASQTHNLIVNAYYVSEVLPSPNGVRQFMLRRQTLIGGEDGPEIRDEEVIPGVEDLQVQFGVDTNEDGNTDQYVNPESVPAGARIVSARLWLLVIAEDREIGFVNDTDFEYANKDYGAFGDDRRRLLLTKTIQIRNSTL